MKIAKLLKLLNEKRVKYVIIGAYACAAHGHVRATQDLDILIDASDGNIAKLRKALEAFGYDTQDASDKDFKTKKILFRQYWLDLDTHPIVKGAKPETVLKNSILGEFEGVRTRFASLKDLIHMKKSAGRPKDKEDIKSLEAIIRK
jgi:predicted nucleotidyltransferase